MLKIVAMSYKRLSDVMRSLDYKVPEGVAFKVLDVIVNDVKDTVRDLEQHGDVDVYLSAGANAHLIAQHSDKPLVTISLSGFDVLDALHAASKEPGDVAVVTFQGAAPDLEPMFSAIGIKAVHNIYRSTYELEGLLRILKQQGVRKIVGTSLVIEKAMELGMSGYFIYSRTGVRDAVERCFHIARVNQAEAERVSTLQTVLNYTYGGIIAVDTTGTVTEFNHSAEKILGVARQSVLGKKIDKALPEFGVKELLLKGERVTDSLKTVSGVSILANSVPVMAGGAPSGLVITFQDIGTINESEQAIRRTLYQKGFYAKTKFDGILGKSGALLEAKEQARLYAQSNSAVLVTGESGTGKELFAQAIHNASARSRRPFVAINCASLPPDLLQSELFGYAEGSFTGAKKGGKPGLFEMADKGTLFLDEIGEIPKSIQALLLRAVETREVMRVGGEQIFSTDIRVIAATNRDLWGMVEANEFREDLYYRLCTLQIAMPPLRERREDIPELAFTFLRDMRGDLPEKTVRNLVNDPMLLTFPWHGNIRELRNLMERFAALYQGTGDPAALFRKILLVGDRKPDIRELQSEKRKEVFEAMKAARGNKTRAAAILGVSRTTLWRKLREFG